MADLRLYCILDLGHVAHSDAEHVTGQLLAGGADLIQLRGKNYDAETIHRIGVRILPLCRAAGVPLIINDFAEVASALNADGLHLGQDDGSLAAARNVVGEKMTIGRSTHSLEQAQTALIEGFDYIGFGPIYPTPTKLGRPGIGISQISEMEKSVGSRIPAFCIGGISKSTLLTVITAGARRVVMVSDLLKSTDVAAATRSAKQVVCRAAPEDHYSNFSNRPHPHS